MNDETAKELVWAIRALTEEIHAYARIKLRGIRLAERIEDDRASRVWVEG